MYMKIAEEICRLRAAAGMSQEELAAKLEISRQSVSKWETGASVPDVEKLVKMAELFGVTLDELVTGNRPEPMKPEEKRMTLWQILGATLLVLAGLCVAVTVLFESYFAFHTSEGILLAAWFALLGAIALDPGNDKLRRGAFAVWSVLALVFLLLWLLRIFWFQGVGLFVLIGLALAAWSWRAGGK
jgi:transcriptional regulator with XRE-family HTH domain